VTHLRQIMLEELQRRNYSESTIPLTFEQSSTTPDTSTVPRINSVQNIFANIRQPCSASGKLAPNTVTRSWRRCVSSMCQVLKRGWSVARHRIEEGVALPQVLSPRRSHVYRCGRDAFSLILLMTLYATGARRARGGSFKDQRPSTASGWSSIFKVARDARTATSGRVRN